MRQFIFFGIFRQGNNFFALQIRQSLMITVSQRPSDYFFHNRGIAFHIKLSKSLVIFFSINKFDIYRDKPFANQRVIINNSPYASIAIAERMDVLNSQMQFCNTLNNVFAAGRVIFSDKITSKESSCSLALISIYETTRAKFLASKISRSEINLSKSICKSIFSVSSSVSVQFSMALEL